MTKKKNSNKYTDIKFHILSEYIDRNWNMFKMQIYIYIYLGSAHGVMVIIVGNGHGDTSSNPGRDWLHFT